MDRQVIEGFFDEIEKLSQMGDAAIDDLYAAPEASLVPTLKRVHNLGKSSSWTEIGPVGQDQGSSASFPRMPRSKHSSLEKRAEPPPPPGVSLAHWDKILQGSGGSRSKKSAGLTPQEKAQRTKRYKAVGNVAGAVGGGATGALLGVGLGRTLSRRPGVAATISSLGAAAGTGLGLKAGRHAGGALGRGKSRSEAAEKVAYRLQGHTEVQGIPISIENRKGSVRTGTDADGNEWRTKMLFPYGYIPGTKGADDEPVDCYVGPDKEAPNAYVVHQHKDDGKGYDEDKIFFGFRSKREAREAFLKHYDDPKFLGPISKVSLERLRELVASKKRLAKITEKTAAATKQRNKLMEFLRKAGPGLGGAAGLVAGGALGHRKGKALRGALAGLGTGATLGWVPDMAYGVQAGIAGLKR